MRPPDVYMIFGLAGRPDLKLPCETWQCHISTIDKEVANEEYEAFRCHKDCQAILAVSWSLTDGIVPVLGHCSNLVRGQFMKIESLPQCDELTRCIIESVMDWLADFFLDHATFAPQPSKELPR